MIAAPLQLADRLSSKPTTLRRLSHIGLAIASHSTIWLFETADTEIGAGFSQAEFGMFLIGTSACATLTAIGAPERQLDSRWT